MVGNPEQIRKLSLNAKLTLRVVQQFGPIDVTELARKNSATEAEILEDLKILKMTGLVHKLKNGSWESSHFK